MSEHMSEHANLTVAGSTVEVMNVDGHEGLSQLFEIAVDSTATSSGLRPSSIVGQEASLTLHDGVSATRTISAIVARARSSYHDDGNLRLHTILRPAAWLLTRGRNCHSFQHKTVVDIVSEVLAGVSHRWELNGAYADRAYTVQYREDNWSFICRLLEQEGIHFWFDHGAGSQLVLSDNSKDAPDLVGGPRIEVHDEDGLTRAEEAIQMFGAAKRVTPTKFSVKSFDSGNPALDVSATAGGGALEFYDAPGGGPADPAEATRQARFMSERATSTAATVHGHSNSVRLTPGRAVEPSGHLSLDGRYVVTQLRYQVQQRRRGDAQAERAYDCQFSAMTTSAPFISPRNTPPARQAGIQSGSVIGGAGAEIFPSERGEVRVQQHWDRLGARNDKAGTWMRVAQRGTADSLQLPRVGWNVLTFNEEGSVDTPNVLSRLNDAEHPPAYALPANKTRVVFKTATSPADGTFNEIYFEDIKGGEEMFINASKDMNVLVQRGKNEGILRDSTRKVGVDHDLTVGDDYGAEIKRDQSTSIAGNDTTTISANRSEQVDGNLDMSVGGNRNIIIGGSHDDNVADNRDLTVGAAVIDVSLDSINAQADYTSLLVGGLQLKMSRKGVSDSHGAVSVQTIGGARLEFTKKDRQLDVEKYLFETVGGLLMIKTDENYGDSATTTNTWTVGAAITTQTPELLIRAVDKLEIQCGDSALVLLPESLEIRTPELDLSKAKTVQTETPLVEHND